MMRLPTHLPTPKSLLLAACMLLPVMSAKENISSVLVSSEPLCTDTIVEKKHLNVHQTRSSETPQETKKLYPEELEKIFAPEIKHKKSISHLLAEFHNKNEYFYSCNRQEAYQELISRHPGATKHKAMLEKSFFLHEGWYAYLEVEEQLKELLRQTEAENLGSYSWFMQQSRDLTKKYNEKFDAHIHLYINETYLDYLQDKLQDSIVSPKILTLFPSRSRQTAPASFARTDQPQPRQDTLGIGSEKFFSTHLPASFAHYQLTKQGYLVVSSRNGADDGSVDHGDRTCTHGLQPIVFSGLTLLEEKLKSTHGISMDHKIIRGGTERGHFFGGEKKGLIAGQIDPSYNKHIKLHNKHNNIHTGTIKKPRLIFTTHGYGTTIDLSIASPEWVRAMEEFLSTGQSIGLGYKLLPVGVDENNEDLYIIALQHGKDTNYHFHIGFASESQLQACNLITPKQNITEPLPTPVTVLTAPDK